MLDSCFSDACYHEKPLENSSFNLKLLFIMKKHHQIFTSNPVILYLLNLMVGRSLKVIGSPIITMSEKFELNR